MIVPVGERVLVEQEKIDPSTTIIIAGDDSDELKKKPRGTIVLAGNMLDPNFRLNIGDMVYFNSYSGERVMEGDKEWLLLKPGEILAKFATG